MDSEVAGQVVVSATALYSVIIGAGSIIAALAGIIYKDKGKHAAQILDITMRSNEATQKNIDAIKDVTAVLNSVLVELRRDK